MFKIGQSYERGQLLDYVGSKQPQSGIIWGPKEPRCVIVTSGGKGLKALGYGDRKNDDGSVYYFGQGEKGDQNPEKFSNLLLINGARSILFFSTKEPNADEIRMRGNYRKLYQFEGIFEVASWDFFMPSEGIRKNDKLLRFLLVPVNNVLAVEMDSKFNEMNTTEPDLDYLRNKISPQSGTPEKGNLNAREYYRRGKMVHEYATARAKGVCELCGQTAPFQTIDGIPFLEVHHIFRLADDGPDEPQNVAALCPNCHKKAHFSGDIDNIKTELARIISEKESII